MRDLHDTVMYAQVHIVVGVQPYLRCYHLVRHVPRTCYRRAGPVGLLREGFLVLCIVTDKDGPKRRRCLRHPPAQQIS